MFNTNSKFIARNIGTIINMSKKEGNSKNNWMKKCNLS